MRRSLTLLPIFAMVLTFVGFGTVQASSAEPQANAANRLQSSVSKEPAQRGSTTRAAAVPGVSAPSTAWSADGTALVIFQSFQGELDWKFWTAQTGWQGWFTAGAPAAGLDASTVSATWALDNTNVNVFVKGASDGHLYQYDLFNELWVDLGGVLVQGPSATSTVGGRIDVFGFGSDNRLHMNTFNGSFWTGWAVSFAAPPAGFSSAPAASWAATSQLDIFATGASDGALYQLSWVAGRGWGNWGNLGGVLVSPPSASWTGNGRRLDVFGVGSDFRLYQRGWAAGSGWTNWIPFAPTPGGLDNLGPSVSWVADGSRLDVMAANAPDGSVYQLYWTSATGWRGWFNMG